MNKDCKQCGGSCVAYQYQPPPHPTGSLPILCPCVTERMAKLEKVAEALKGILTNAALDWYVDLFTRPENPSPESGIKDLIHNRTLKRNAFVAYERAREALAAMEET